MSGIPAGGATGAEGSGAAEGGYADDYGDEGADASASSMQGNPFA